MIFQTLLGYLDLSTWLLFTFLVLLLWDVVRYWRPATFPPGPSALPFLGNVFTGMDYKDLDKLAKEYGPVYSLRRGSERIVFVSGYRMFKEALVNQLDSFADRPQMPLFDGVFKGIGVGLSNGYPWKKHRKFTVSHLRYFGEGQRSLENHIRVECGYLCEAFKEEQGQPFNPQFTLTAAVGNVLASVLFGHRFEYNDGSFRRFLELDNEAIVLAGSTLAQLYNVFPSLIKRLPGSHQKVISNYREIEHFLMQEVQKHQEEWNPEQPRDFIDAYIAEIEKLKEDPQAGFNIGSLLVSTLDLLEAGTESGATTLRWAMVYMMHYPVIQKEVQAEIDRVIGQSRLPASTDRAEMHYTEAVIHETQRIANIVPLGFPKMASKEATLGGYIIPKGTTLVAHLGSVLQDKNEWETPDRFNPRHFLDSKNHFRRRDAFLPFSAGKRACLGEQLARMELFMFFTALLQRFTFTPVPGEMPDLVGVQGFTQSPQQFRFLAVPR
ncbi:cytochrome P450 2J2-like [Stigmatopora argus]